LGTKPAICDFKSPLPSRDVFAYELTPS
jgi:hypothetical protein